MTTPPSAPPSAPPPSPPGASPSSPDASLSSPGASPSSPGASPASPASPDDWLARGDFFDWRGHRIFFRAEGSGTPVLLVHGFPTASWDWSTIWPALAARYRVLSLDMIGFGFSAKPRDFAYSIFAQADLFDAFLARENISAYHLIAHDYGDTVAQELLARQSNTPSPSPPPSPSLSTSPSPSPSPSSSSSPSTATATSPSPSHPPSPSPSPPRILSTCLLNGGLFPETHRPLITQKLLASPLGPLIARLGGRRALTRSMRRIWGRTPVSDAELHAISRLVAEHDGFAIMPKLIGYIAERHANRERWVGALTTAPMPLRFINGLLDPISGAHMVARYRELVPHPDVVELPDAGHYPQLEAPGAVLAAILTHLERTP